MMQNKYTVYVPAKHKDAVDVAAAIRALTEKAGGMTAVPSFGIWYDKNGSAVMDEIVLMSWWHEFTLEETRPLLIELINSLLYVGESAVMVETTFDGVTVADVFGLDPEG